MAMPVVNSGFHRRTDASTISRAVVQQFQVG
jgi:hypothetical protein